VSRVPSIVLGEIMATKSGSVDPSKFTDEIFDLYSIPAFDRGEPEVVAGSEVGSAKQVVKTGDVLLSKIVPHIRRSWVVGPERGRRIIASGEWIVFRTNRANPHYLRRVLVGDPFHAQFMNTVAGVGGSLLRARPTHVASISIPLPPLPEQRRIADILDKADALRAKRRAALAQLNTLTQSIFLDMFGDPATNPKGWTTAPLADAVLGKHGVKAGPFGSSLKKEDYTTSGYRIYGQEQVIAGRFDTGDYYIGERKFQQLKSCAVAEGDLLVSLVGSFGRVLIVPKGIEPGIINPRLLKITANQKLLIPVFVAAFLEQPSVQAEFQRVSHGGTMGILNAGLLKRHQFMLPPLSLQRTFVARVAAVEKLKATHRKSLADLEALFASLQHRAFRGEL
jgi:type I restriction enzyme S subunit